MRPIRSGSAVPPADRPDLGAITGIVYDHWLAIHPAPGVLPGRRHFDPLDFGTRFGLVLPHLWLLDVGRDPWRFRFRLMGGAIIAAGGKAKPGDDVVQFDPHGVTVRRLVRVCEERRPSFHRGPPMLDHRNHVRSLEALVLPLAADGRTVDMLLNCTVYEWEPGYGPASSVG